MTDEEIPPGGTAVAGPQWALARVHPGQPWIGSVAGSL